MSLTDWVTKVVKVVTCDGRVIVGTLRGFDQAINVVLEDSHERVFSSDAPVAQTPLGLYVIRGDNM